MQHILITGGAGYIGSHTALALLEAGFSISIVDNFANSSIQAVERLQQLSAKRLTLHQFDLADKQRLQQVFSQTKVDAVMHFAGLKAVGESVAQPLRYYANNLLSSINLVQVMQANECRTLIFSSSATVYGAAKRMPISEQESIKPTNTYGHTKAMIEQMLIDQAAADSNWRICLLRYFNPVGAHPSGRIGEDPRGMPNNLMPVISQVAMGRLACVQVFGSDYPTADGSGVRDYIHVQDLAAGHLAALRYLDKLVPGQGACLPINLGTGMGYSVLDLIECYQNATGARIAYQQAPRRAGDVAECYADPSQAQELFGWSAKQDLASMCASAHNWQIQNPNGYSA